MYRQIVGMIACVERFLTDAEERGNAFFLEVLEKQHTRMKGIYERRVVRDPIYSHVYTSFTYLSIIERANKVRRGYEADEQETQWAYSIHQVLPYICWTCRNPAGRRQCARDTSSCRRLLR